MSKAQDLTDKALNTFDDLRAQIDFIIIEVEANDFGTTGIELLAELGEIESKLRIAYSALEDAYSLVEDLELTP